MKTIIAQFEKDGCQVTATACFATLPGESAVEWQGEATALLAALPAPFNRQLPAIEYAETFERSMQTLAAKAGASLELSATGEWQVFEM